MLLSPFCPQSHNFHSRFRGVEQFYDDIKKYFLPVRGFSVITNPGHLITRTLPASAEIFSTQNLFKRVDKCGVRKPRLFSTACPPTLTPEQVSGSSTVGQGSKWQSSSLWPPITITLVLPFSALALLKILIFLFPISFFCTHLKYLRESPWHCVASWWDTQPRKYFDVVSEFWLITLAPLPTLHELCLEVLIQHRGVERWARIHPGGEKHLHIQSQVSWLLADHLSLWPCPPPQPQASCTCYSDLGNLIFWALGFLVCLCPCVWLWLSLISNWEPAWQPVVFSALIWHFQPGTVPSSCKPFIKPEPLLKLSTLM